MKKSDKDPQRAQDQRWDRRKLAIPFVVTTVLAPGAAAADPPKPEPPVYRNPPPPKPEPPLKHKPPVNPPRPEPPLKHKPPLNPPVPPEHRPPMNPPVQPEHRPIIRNPPPPREEQPDRKELREEGREAHARDGKKK